MRTVDLPDVEGYDPATQHVVAYMAAQLDDQLHRLKEAVADLEPAALAWQPAPGRNTIGMLLAHVAIVEAWWLQAGAKGIHERAEVDRIVQGVVGIRTHEDGIPLPEDGGHPDVLAGWTARDHAALLDRTRVASHVVLRGWTDDDLAERVTIKDRAVGKGWILYHVVEHLAAHLGQVLLLRRLHAARTPPR